MASDIIAKANTKDKVIDFRDGLVRANDDDYAMMQGVGGQNHAPNSVIRITICDYSKGKGDSSVTVSANVTTDVIDIILNICRQNIGLAVSFEASAEAQDAGAMIGEALAKARSLIKGAKDAAQLTINTADMIELGQMIAKANEAMGKKQLITRPQAVDFNLTQEKVNVHKKDGNGYAPVSRFTVLRQTYRSNGDKSNYPWTFKITNGIAPVREQDTGATTFDAKAMKDIKEAYINVSDRDVYRMMYRVARYVEVWENTICIPLIKAGIQQREANRAAYLARRT